MSLRKSPRLTPAFLAANRRNAQKSTGPRTAGGKARARLNRLRHGRRSPLFTRFRTALRENPSRSRWVSQSLLTLEDTRHLLFAYYLRQWGQVWARTHAYQLTFKRKLKRIERLARLLRDVGLTPEVKKEIEFEARYGIWQQPRARGHQLSPILSQNRRKTSERGTPHSGIRPEPECARKQERSPHVIAIKDL